MAWGARAYVGAGVAVIAAVLALQGCKKHDRTPATVTTVTTTTTTPAAVAAPAPTDVAQDSGPMVKVGDCTSTTVKTIGSRLEGAPDSGSAIEYDNGVSQVSYDTIPGITHSQPGDAVKLCLAELPTNCPPGDTRGSIYSATNQRTGETWKEADSEHSCGGA
jgi:hypothetical protein